MGHHLRGDVGVPPGVSVTGAGGAGTTGAAAARLNTRGFQMFTETGRGEPGQQLWRPTLFGETKRYITQKKRLDFPFVLKRLQMQANEAEMALNILQLFFLYAVLFIWQYMDMWTLSNVNVKIQHCL